MLLCRKIRLEVTPEDVVTLEFMQAKCRGLYNWWVGRLRDGERWPLVYEAKKSLQESKRHDPELVYVYGKLLHEVYFRLDKAMKAFYRRVNAGEKPGFPRYRKRHEFFTLCYPAMYIVIDGNRLILPTGGKGVGKRFPNVAAWLTETPPYAFKEVAITRDARGNYYASFVSENSEYPPTDKGVIAFDLGIKTLATGVNEQGRIYHIGGFKGARWYNKQLDKIRSKRDKCKKKSKRYIRLSNVYKRISEKKRNKQRDSLHKASHLISHKLAASAVVVGDLSQRQMVANQHIERNKHLNRSVFNEWGCYTFVQMLLYKCQLYGKEFHQISENDTSKTCYICGRKQDMPLYKRMYRCENCGLVMDRDENSAHNILMRFLARLEPHVPDGTRCADVITAIEHV
jgi:putative transposase